MAGAVEGLCASSHDFLGFGVASPFLVIQFTYYSFYGYSEYYSASSTSIYVQNVGRDEAGIVRNWLFDFPEWNSSCHWTFCHCSHWVCE